MALPVWPRVNWGIGVFLSLVDEGGACGQGAGEADALSIAGAWVTEMATV